MKFATTILAGYLALNMIAPDAHAGPRNDGKPRTVERREVHAQKKLREVTATEFTAQAQTDAKQLLAELHKTGLKITELNTLGANPIEGVTAALTTVSGIAGGDITGIRLRLKKGNQLIIRIGKITAAQSASATGQAAQAPDDDDVD